MSSATEIPDAPEDVAEALVRRRTSGALKIQAFKAWPVAPRHFVARVLWALATLIIVAVFIAAGVVAILGPGFASEAGPVEGAGGNWFVAGLAFLGAAAWLWLMIAELTAVARLRRKAMAEPEWARTQLTQWLQQRAEAQPRISGRDRG